MALESLIVTLLIDVYEGRDVATFDVPGAYLQSDIAVGDSSELVMLKFVGEFVDIICQVNLEHKKTIVYEKGKKNLYMHVLKAIYVCI